MTALCRESASSPACHIRPARNAHTHLRLAAASILHYHGNQSEGCDRYQDCRQPSVGTHQHHFDILRQCSIPCAQEHARICFSFFATMFELPQPSPFPDHVQTEESSTVLDILFRYIYPLRNQQMESLSVVESVLWAAHKFEMDFMSSLLRPELVSARFMVSDPLAVYAIACEGGFKAEAKTASRETLRIRAAELLTSHLIYTMTSRDLVSLLNLRSNRLQAVKLTLPP